ncbi:MAG: hypothetical protein IJB91_00365 [Oscillospiraceae bacterium]|nr:hypothetical protein [Oscillospiraceae bacterium]
MKRNLKDFLRLVQCPLTIAAGLMPVPILLFTYLQPQLQKYAWIFPVSYFVLTALSFLLPGKLRLPFGLLSAVAIVLPWPFLLTGESLALCLAVAIIFDALLLWSIRMGGWNAEKELHSAWIGVCLVAQFLGLGVQLLDRQTAQHPLTPMAPWFYLSFFVTVILCMLAMNRKALNTITQERTAVVKAMHRKNVVLVFLLVGAAAVISLLPSAMGAINIVIGWIRQLLKVFERDYSEDIMTVPPMTETAEPEDLGTGFAPNVGKHTDILNIMFQVFFIVLVAVALPFLLYFLWKRLRGVAKKLWRSLRNFTSDSTAEYEDEITDTRDSVIADEEEIIKPKRRRRILSDRGLSNTEKIRHRYRQLQKKNPQWRKSSTARENLPEASAGIYERARYSPHPVTSEDADLFKTETKRM